MFDLTRHYRVLEIEPGATLDEIEQAYKDLVFVWHPDRLPPDNPRLQAKAQEKLKALNQAREALRERLSRLQPVKSKNQTGSHAGEPRPSRYQPTPSSGPRWYQPVPRPTEPTRAKASTPADPPRNPPRNPSVETAPPQKQAPPKRPIHPDLSGVNWQGRDLQEKYLEGRNLSGANLSQANLTDAFMHRVNLSGANLRQANLFRANLFQADLSQADLQEANLECADLSGANLSGANLTNARLGIGNRGRAKMTGAILKDTIMPDGSVYSGS
jgi:curved DNA-binding protein CbpA